jgi:hypothetical protein
MRNTIRIVAAAAAALFSLVPLTGATQVGSGEGSTAKAPLSVALGKADFKTYCASCHGRSGIGNGPVAKFLALEPADLTKLSRKNHGLFPRGRIAAVIDGREAVKVHGPRDMPVWGNWFNVEAEAPGLRAQEREPIVRARIEALVHYIETIQEK